MAVKMLRLPGLKDRSGDGRSSIYRKIKSGLLTPPVKLSERMSAWPEDEIDQILRARIAGQTDAQVRELVKRLIQRRAEQIVTA